VFEELVDTRTSHGSCQLVYTTHSPFLVNRNFPRRVRLVRKGDGSEGTQYVQRSAVRRFEPVRTALSIDAADTLFLGSTNVILEGFSDLKLLTACIQRFGEPGKLDEMLDLNSITLVAAGGAPYASELVRKAMKGDEKPPVVVVLLDGDEPGMNAVAGLEKLLGPQQVTTLRAIEAGAQVFQVLEDLIPVPLLDLAIQAYATLLNLSCASVFDGTTDGAHQGQRLVRFCRTQLTGLEGFEDAEIRSGVVETLVELLEDPTFHSADNEALRSNVREVCKRINHMIEHAQRSAQRRSLKSLVRQQVETFWKRFSLGASKGDIRKLLSDISHSAFGRAEDFERTRQNVDSLLERLDKEAQQNSDPIDLGAWRTRLDRLKNEPWTKVGDWTKVVSFNTAQKLAPPPVIASRVYPPCAGSSSDWNAPGCSLLYFSKIASNRTLLAVL
jgi:hypothetical protein